MYEPLLYFALSLGLVPLFQIGLRRFKNSHTLFILPFVCLVFFSSIYEFLSFRFNWSSAYWFRFYTFFDFLFIFYFYYQNLKNRFRNYFIFSLIAFFILFVYLLSIWDVNQCDKTEFYLITFESIFVLIRIIQIEKNFR